MQTDSKTNGKVVLIFGASGAAGSAALKESFLDPNVSEVRAIVRRSLGVSDSKLREILCSNFNDFSTAESSFSGVDTCLYCLGTSVRNVKGEEEYREIHLRYPLSAARTLFLKSPTASFVFISGAGTNRKSRMMWARVKAETEDKLAKVGLRSIVNARPGAIVSLEESGLKPLLVTPLIKLFPALFISTKEFSKALLKAGLTRNFKERSTTLENKELRKLAQSSGYSEQE